MQDSFLENDQQQNQAIPIKKFALPHSQKKMYKIQLPFMNKFKQQLQTIQSGIQSILISLTNTQQNEKKRIPYHVIKSFQKNLKQLRNLKQFTIEENKVYLQEVANREKQKICKNVDFKCFLKQYGNKRQELKAYINKLQTRIRKLQDTGYAQYVQYEVMVPEINTIRFSFSNKTLLYLTDIKIQTCKKIQQEIRRRKYNIKKLKDISKLKIQQKRKQSQQIAQQQKLTQAKLPLLSSQSSPNISKTLQFYKIYKYYENDCILFLNLLKIHNKKQEHKQQINTLKIALKQNEQKLYKQKLQNGVRGQNPTFTKTDNLILMKQYKNQIKYKLENRIFLKNQKIKNRRSLSWGNFWLGKM